MKRPLLLALLVVAALGAIAGVAFVVTKRFAPRPRREIVVRVDRAASAPDNESVLTMTLEHSLSSLPGLRQLRSETTTRGVSLSLFFDRAPDGAADPALVATLFESLQGTARLLPPRTTYPTVTTVVPETRIFLRSRAPVRGQIAQIPGVISVDACGEPSGIRPRIVVASEKLAALGGDLLDVRRVLLTAPPMVGGDVGPLANATLLSANGATVRLEDVASVNSENVPSNCDSGLFDGAAPFFDVVHVQPASEKDVLAALAKLGEPLAEEETLRVRVFVEEGSVYSSQRDLVSKAANAMAKANALVLHGVVEREGTAELVFALAAGASKSSASIEAGVDELHAIASRTPRLVWGGARSRFRKSVRRLRVTLRGPELDELATRAARLETKLGALERVSSVSRPLEQGPSRLVTVDHAAVARNGVLVSADDVRWAAEVTLGDEPGKRESPEITVMRPGLDALRAAALKKIPLSSLVRIEGVVAPRFIVREDLGRVLVLEYEAKDAAAEARMKKAFEAMPEATNATITPVD